MSTQSRINRWTTTFRSWAVPAPLLERLPESEALALGRRKIRRSQAMALLFGAVLLASGLFRWSRWPLGLFIGLFYANAFEYLCHRFLLHSTKGYLSQRHQIHHESWRRWDGALFIRFGPPLVVIVLLLANSLPFTLGDHWGAGIGAGVLLAFVAYYVAHEEMHWRIHVGTLPRWLLGLRRNHFAHHRDLPGKYSVLLPLLDKILQ